MLALLTTATCDCALGTCETQNARVSGPSHPLGPDQIVMTTKPKTPYSAVCCQFVHD